jgi:soluble lytic murein transglycosylase
VAATLQVGLVCGLPLVAEADIYRAIEPDGTISYTNVPTHSRFKKIDRVKVGRDARMPFSRLERTIVLHSERHGLHPALLSAIIKAESDFDPTAVSRSGAVGLMQLMPKTALKLNVRDPFDPEENIAGGARYLRYLLDRYEGNLPLALAAYNAGETQVERYQTLPPIPETRRYVSKVLRFYRAYLFGDRAPILPTVGSLMSPTPSRTVAFPTAISP